MNILINTNQSARDQLVETNEFHELCKSYRGEQFAAAVLILYTATALIISIWSAIVFVSGNIESGGPIGLIFRMLKTSGVI